MPDLLAAGLLSAALIVACVVIHYEGLHLLSQGSVGEVRSVRRRLILLMLGVILIHLVEAGLFGVGYWIGAATFGMGGFAGTRPARLVDYFYFSLETMTTQGVGDIYAVGALRMVAALEPVMGLMLFGWSTSFTFLVMRRFWHLAPARRSHRRAAGHAPAHHGPAPAALAGGLPHPGAHPR